MNHSNDKAAVVLLSGGLDSATCLAIANSRGYRCYALSVDYGQRHHSELAAAEKVAQSMSAELKTIKLDLRAFGGSALTDDIDVPEEEGEGIPVTYVPARNTIMLSLALAWAEVLWTIRATRIAGRNTSMHMKKWLTSRPRPAWRATG